MNPIPGPENRFRMIACPSLSHERRTDGYFPAGRTVGEYLRDELGWQTSGLTARVTIDGVLIPDAEWLTAEPKAGQSVVVRRIYTGGPGGNAGKQIGMIIGMLAIAFAAAAVAPGLAGGLATALGATGGTWGGLVGALIPTVTGGLTIGGALALNGHVPRSRPRRLPQQPVRELQEAA